MTTWNIDSAHSEIGFKVRHLMITNVKGKFADFSGSVMADDDTFNNGKINFSATVASITTGNAMRDGHLQSADFFDATNFPTLTFASKSVVPTADDEFKVVGDLTMRGVTKEITLMAHFHGISKDMHSERVAGFDLSGSINRTDFGLLWNAAVETGGVTVSDEVKLEMEIEAKEMKQ
jgi:polyisoprenoid-binding protein YceI